MLAFLILINLALIPYLIPLGPLTRNLRILTEANLLAILAVSWDLLVGRTGQISLGHAIFFGIGAYGTAILYKYLSWPIWVTIPISIVAGAAIALIIGVPCLRLKGPYLALLTMALPIAVTGFIIYFFPYEAGQTGYISVPRIFQPSLFPTRELRMYGPYIANYYLSLALMTISSVIIYKVATSKTGIVFISILDDELGAKACGINVTKYKLLSLTISGLFGSLAGAFYAHIVASAAHTRLFLDVEASLPMKFSFIPIVSTILGGIGTIYGPILGTYIYILLENLVFPQIFNYLTNFGIKVDPGLQIPITLAIFLSIVVLLIVRWPRGIARAIVEKLEDLEEPREVEEILKGKTKGGEKS
ncbi:MAG: branched-chain amino acid ABC transporter permease [Candidatus Bathyarchaeia archaeon]